MSAILSGMTAMEVVQWDASMALDPDESDKADLRHALLMDWLFRLLVPRKRGQQPHPSQVADHLRSLPWREDHEARESRPKTPRELMDKINAVMRTLGGKPRGG